MIPKECKRLAEVDFPIAVVSKHAAREKSIRHGHPSTLHLWWARRPLAACRSMLMALLLPDPCDPHCPAEFKTKARELLAKVTGTTKDTKGTKEENEQRLRQALLRFIGEFANWDLASDRTYLEIARGLVKAAHPEETPLVVDPFAGGGSIPLEALRLGCDAFASDLNPVACLINKVLLEDIPRHGPELAEELRRVGAEVKKAAERELAEFYPVDPDGARPIAYLWARTVRCEAPNCGAEIPLLRSFWLCKKADRRRALRTRVFLPSPSGRGAGGEGEGEGESQVKQRKPHHAPLPADLLEFARKLRKEQTDAEKLMWFLLRDRRLAGRKFRRQHPVEPYVLDFYCHELRLAVELDGGQHNMPEGRRHDEKRSKFLVEKGIRVLRFWNHDVLRDTEVVLEAIWNEVMDQGASPSPPTPLPEGEGSKKPSSSGRGLGEGIPRVEFEIFTPTTEKDVRGGTVSRAKATCVCCGTVLHPDRVRTQLAAQRGGADVVFEPSPPTPLPEGEGSKIPSPSGRGQGEGIPRRIGGARLLAVVTLRDGEPGRHYRLPTEADHAAVWKAQQRLKVVAATKRDDGPSPIPDEPLPPVGTLGFRVQRYGMMQWGDLFTARQKVGLLVLVDAVSMLTGLQSARDFMSIALSRYADIFNALCQWESSKTQVRHLFTRQALPILWDHAEGSMLGEQAGDYSVTLQTMRNVVDRLHFNELHGQTNQADACSSPLPEEGVSCWFTDPPYHDAIPYSDLSDFFLVWLKRTLPGHPLLRDPFDPTNPLSPKLQEAVQDETKKVNGRPKDRAWFEDTMARASAEGRRVLRDGGIGSVVFAHKTTEGWEALLGGLIRGGWTITGSWPISTEMATRLRARESAALATSVHLVCRPRPADAPIGDWGQVLRELPRRVADWMNRLQEEGVRGADLVFACMGPALEIYSRYSKVVDDAERLVGEVIGQILPGLAQPQVRDVAPFPGLAERAAVGEKVRRRRAPVSAADIHLETVRFRSVVGVA
jgi:adenine-specific DNA methylase